MRHGSANKRSRNRGGSGNNSRGRGNQGRTQVFDSNGPDVRIRGTAHQVHEKYIALAKDASGSGDYILAESYLQHAEHYQRIIGSWQQTAPFEREVAEDDQDDEIESDSFISRRNVVPQVFETMPVSQEAMLESA